MEKIKARRFYVLLVCLIIVFLATGCGKHPLKTSGKGTLKVIVDWEKFEQSEIQLMGAFNLLGESSEEPSLEPFEEQGEDTSTVTHTGVRVVYPDENAAYSQSVTREIAETQGIITLEIPATTNAKMYAVAVHSSDLASNRRALKLGYVENITILADSITTVTMDDIDWVTATWYPGEGYENYAVGLFAPKEDDKLLMPIYVRDPFQIGQDITYDEAMIKVLGRNGCRENTNGWRRFEIYHENPSVGEENTKEYTFQPYLESLFFNLPRGQYLIEPIVTPYTVTWE